MSTPEPPDPANDWLKACARCSPDTPVDALWRCLEEGLSLLEEAVISEPPRLEEFLTALLGLTLDSLLPACAEHSEVLRTLLTVSLSSLEERYHRLDADSRCNDAEADVELYRLQAHLWFLHLISLALDGATPTPYEDLLTHLETLRARLAHTASSQLQTLDNIYLEVLGDQARSCSERARALLGPAPDDPDRIWQQAATLVETQDRSQRLYTLLLDGITRSDADVSISTRARAQEALRSLDDAQSTLIEETVTLVNSLPEEKAQEWLEQKVPAMMDFAADVLSDIPDRRMEVQVRVLEASYRRIGRFCSALVDPRRRSLKEYHKQIKAIERRLRGEWVEAGVSAAMARRFGARFEGRLDIAVLLLVAAAIGMLMVDLSADLDAAAFRNLVWLDTAICACLMADFLLRLGLAPDRADFFRRHWLTDLLPSIPFASLGLWISSIATEATSITALRILRVVAVALRKARPIVQVARVFLFAARGMDRLVRRYRNFLNWDILFFEPRPLDPTESLRLRARRLGRRIRVREKSLRDGLDLEALARATNRDLDLARHLGHALARVQTPGGLPATPPATRQIAVETVIDRLTHTDPYEITEVLGVDFPHRLARLVWVASLPPMRWLPLFSDVLRARRTSQDDLEFAEDLAKRLGRRLKWLNDKILFLSDMHGVITAPQFVDRIGSTLVESMRRPRNRLLMLGAGFIVVTLLVEVLPFDWLEATAGWLRKTLGWPILILGLIAFAAVWFGNRLRLLARTNTDLYTRVAEAKSINLLGDVKQTHADGDRALLARRVLHPEARIRGLPVSNEERPAATPGSAADQFRDMVFEVFGQDEHGIPGSLGERIYLLYRDYLRGAHFDRGNTHTTDLLLGSPALLNLRHQVLRLGPKVQKALEELDLRRSSGIAGPSLWLRFVTHAMTQRVGQLVEEYNRHAIPHSERNTQFHAQDALDRFQQWLDHKIADDDAKPTESSAVSAADTHYATTSFNALDFLSNDPARDVAIEKRYGSEVATLVRADRRRLIRAVFGIPPLHLRDTRQRSFNPYQLYHSHLSRGRVFLLPLALLRLLIRVAGSGLRWFRKTLSELRHPSLRPVSRAQDSFSDLRVALRKVHRMRKPVFLASTDLRARLDVEYLGLFLPGETSDTLEGVSVFEDMDIIAAGPEDRANYHRLAELRRRELGELQTFLEQQGLISTPLEQHLAALFPTYPRHRYLEVLRAMCAAYAANYQDLQDLVTGPRRLRKMVRETIRAQGRRYAKNGAKHPVASLRRRVEARRSSARFLQWWEQQGSAFVPPEQDPSKVRKWVRRSWLVDRDHSAHLIDLLSGLERPSEAVAVDILRSVMRNVDAWTEQLVTLRTLQALTILDIRSTTYIICGLGQYDADDGDEEEARMDGP